MISRGSARRVTISIILSGFLMAMGAPAGAQTRSAASPTGLADRLDAVLDRHADTGAVIHASVLELPSRRVLYSRRASEACIPASNLKLLTSAAGLDMFGAKRPFKTWLALDHDDLWIIGSGDPGTGDPRLTKAAGRTPVSMLEDWAAALKQRGIDEIAGDLVYDDSALDYQRVHPAWYKSFLTFWYAAPVAGLNFNDNCVDITVLPTEAGQPVTFEVMPPVASIKVLNECLTGEKNAPSIVKLANESTYKLSGTCHERTELISKPVDNPGAFFAEALRYQLERAGVKVKGRVRRAERPLGGTDGPPSSQVVAVHETPLADIISRINKNSQNMFAEALAKLIGQGYEARQGRCVPGSWEAGRQAVQAFLKANCIDRRPLVMVDGSGLSDRNRVTSDLLVELLAVMFDRKDAETYRASLSVCGVDGSLRERMLQIKGRVYGKTGYIGGVCSTSGYVHTRGGKWLAFSFIYNKLPQDASDDSDTKPFTALHDEACAVLHEWPELPATSRPM